ncbi:MAG: hypothetical protein KDI15_12455 [Thiothrix sp.]|nr:hypothetical protein [Thiothrix sp.]HPE61994.1 hypothetical protein [Thiolinea sp.]
MPQPEEFFYRVPWRSGDTRSGAHPGLRTGTGLEFHSHDWLAHHPDVRNLDLQASLRDPFGQFRVRRMRQSSRLTVVALADLSASMRSFGRRELLQALCRSIAWSSYRNGDRFSFMAAAEQPARALYTPPVRQFASLEPLWQQLARYQAPDRHSRGLLSCLDELPARRSLVFLLSDFHFPRNLLEQLLERLAFHQLVPVLLWPGREYRQLPDWRFVRLRDPESGRVRSLLLRPALRHAISARFEQWHTGLQQCFIRYGFRPFEVDECFEPDRLTDYFWETD